MYPLPINAFACEQCGVIRAHKIDARIFNLTDFATLHCVVCASLQRHVRVGVQLLVNSENDPKQIALVWWTNTLPHMTPERRVQLDEISTANVVAVAPELDDEIVSTARELRLDAESQAPPGPHQRDGLRTREDIALRVVALVEQLNEALSAARGAHVDVIVGYEEDGSGQRFTTRATVAYTPIVARRR